MLGCGGHRRSPRLIALEVTRITYKAMAKKKQLAQAQQDDEATPDVAEGPVQASAAPTRGKGRTVNAGVAKGGGRKASRAKSDAGDTAVTSDGRPRSKSPHRQDSKAEKSPKAKRSKFSRFKLPVDGTDTLQQSPRVNAKASATSSSSQALAASESLPWKLAADSAVEQDMEKTLALKVEMIAGRDSMDAALDCLGDLGSGECGTVMGSDSEETDEVEVVDSGSEEKPPQFDLNKHLNDMSNRGCVSAAFRTLLELVRRMEDSEFLEARDKFGMLNHVIGTAYGCGCFGELLWILLEILGLGVPHFLSPKSVRVSFCLEQKDNFHNFNEQVEQPSPKIRNASGWHFGCASCVP